MASSVQHGTGPSSQGDLPFAFVPQPPDSLEVLDLFSGAGGLALGFREAGFTVEGADREPLTRELFRTGGIGTASTVDLGNSLVFRDVPVLTGGPPCRPWSVVNLKRRGEKHPDYGLLARFFEHVRIVRPTVFLMENVRALGSDSVYRDSVQALRSRGYAVAAEVVRYSDHGAATSRQRLFTVGVRGSVTGADEFFARLRRRRVAAPATVRSAIAWARDLDRGAHADHDWSQLRTIERYAERYASGQYGWKQLDYDAPAPSFGSIAKTYILHPDAGVNGYPTRVLSVREAMSIMGFAREFRFPADTARATRYRMVADAVSPAVARACAEVIRELLTVDSGPIGGALPTPESAGPPVAGVPIPMRAS